MKKLTTALMLVFAFGAAATAQVVWTVTPRDVPTGQTIRMTLTNNTAAGIDLWNTPAFVILDANLKQVFPNGPVLPTLGNLPAGKSLSFTWDQKVGTVYVPPGTYHAAISYSDGVSSYTKRRSIEIRDDELAVSGLLYPGNIVRFDLASPRAAGKAYQVVCSFTKAPRVDLGGFRELEATPDPLFLLSVTAGMPTFQFMGGILDAEGKAVAGILLPNQAALKGLTFHVAHVTIDPQSLSGIFSYSAAKTVVVK